MMTRRVWCSVTLAVLLGVSRFCVAENAGNPGIDARKLLDPFLFGKATGVSHPSPRHSHAEFAPHTAAAAAAAHAVDGLYPGGASATHVGRLVQSLASVFARPDAVAAAIEAMPAGVVPVPPNRRGIPLLSMIAELLGPRQAAGGSPTGGNGGTGWKDLLVLDCSGALRLSSVADTVVNLQSTKSLLEWLAQQLQSRAQCACPDISTEELLRRFVPSVDMLVAFLTGVDGGGDTDDTCAGDFWRGFFTDSLLGIAMGTYKLDLPSTCTYADVAAGKPCTFELHEPVTNTDLQVALAKCPDNAALPYVSVSCSGWYCRNFLQPCNHDADCGSAGECTSVMTVGDIESGLVNASLVSDVSELEQCDVASWAQESMRAFGSLYTSPPATAPTSLKVCFPSEATLDKIANNLAFNTERVSLNSEAAACLATGCPDVTLVGQGVCDEQCNNAACYHDGGDCKAKPVLHCPSTSSTLECSGHGVCHTTRSNGNDDDDVLGRRHLGSQSVCRCEGGYTGEDCTTQVAKCFAPTTTEQPSTKPTLPCSGYGECSSYGCNCQPGHLGEHCELVASTCPLGDNGKVCSGHGVCRGEGTGAAYCQCLQPFSNPPFSVNHTQACQLGETQLFANTCPGWNAEFGVPCNGHGQAQVFEEGDCTCYCDPGYDSPNCTLSTNQATLHTYFPMCSMPRPDDDDGDGGDDDGGDDDDGFYAVCGRGGGVCLPEVQGFPPVCSCHHNLGAPQCMTPIYQYGIAQDFRSCVWKSGGCNETGVVVSSTAIRSWDGTLADGTSAVAADRMSGFAFQSQIPPLTVASQSGESTVLYRSCDGSVGVNSGPANTGFAVSVGTAQFWSQQIMTQAESLQQCRAKSLGAPALTATQFLIRFAINNPVYTTFSYTAGVGGPPSGYDVGFRGADWMAAHPWDTAAFDALPKLVMPSTCSFATVSTSPAFTCSGKYTGMSQSLFTGTYDLGFETTSCPGDTKGFQLPAIGVTATGDVYKAMSQLLPCSSDTECSGTGIACVDMKGAGYLNLGTTASIDPLGYPLFGPNMINNKCATPTQWYEAVHAGLLRAAGQQPPSTPTSDLHFCMYDEGLTQDKVGLWLLSAGNFACLDGSTPCESDPVIINGLSESLDAAAPPPNLNSDVLYHGPSEAPPGASWVEFSVLLPGVAKSDFTLGKATLFKEAVAADLVQTVPSLGSFTPRNVLIMELRGGSDDDLAAHPLAVGAGSVLRRQLSSSGVAVVANLQVQPAAKSDVQKAVSGTNVGGTPGSFASDLGASLAQRGVVSKANANNVAVAPGNTTPGAGGGLTGGEIAGIVAGSVAVAAALAFVGVAWVRRRQRRMRLVEGDSTATVPVLSTEASLPHMLHRSNGSDYAALTPGPQSSSRAATPTTRPNERTALI